MNDDPVHEAPTPARTDPRAERTRRQFIDAGWALLNELRLSEVFGAMTVGTIAARAERSERSFWNHFTDWQSYVDSLIADIPRLRDLGEDETWAPIEVVREVLEGAERSVLPALIEQATSDNWDAMHLPEELDGLMRQLLLLSRVPDEPRLGEALLGNYWGMHHSRYTRIYEATGQALGVEPIPPLCWADFTRVLTALMEGIEFQSICRPGEGMPPELPIAVSSLGLALLRPVGSEESLASRRAVLLARSEGALHHPTGDLAIACREAVCALEATHGDMWDVTTDRSWPHNLWEALANATGRPQLQLRDDLQRPEMIGALAFSTNLPLGVSRRPNDGSDWMLTLTVDWLCALARAARADPWCAHGLLTERLRPGGDKERLLTAVNPGEEFATLLGGPTRLAHHRSVNMTLTAALSDDSVSPAEIAMATASRVRGLTADPT